MSEVVARHEAAHIAACIMLNRVVGRVRLAPNSRDGGLTESFGKLDEDEQVVLLAAVKGSETATKRLTRGFAAGPYS